MRCKLVSILDIDWKKFSEYMTAFNLPYTGVTVTLAPAGHSSSDGKQRTFCSCGHDAAEQEEVCPQCGGKILPVEPSSWGYCRNVTRRDIVGYKDGDTWNYGLFTIDASSVSDTTAAVKMEFRDIFSLKDGKISKIDILSYAVEDTEGPMLSEEPTKALVEYVANTLTSAGFTVNKNKFVPIEDRYIGSSMGRADVLRAYLVQSLDKVFTKENFGSKPLTLHFLLDTVYSQVFIKKAAMSDFSNDIDYLMAELNVPPMAVPILEQLIQTDRKNISTFENWNNWIPQVMWRDIEGSPLCTMLFSRVKHGTMSLGAMVDILSDVYGTSRHYYHHHKWTDETRELFIPFCKENFDIFKSEALVTSFFERVNWLKEHGHFLSEENLRTRNYWKLYNLQNFKKTLRNTDIEELIQSDPLLLISRIR